MSLCTMVPIKVVMNWIDAGVVAKAKLLEYGVSPRYSLDYREIRRTIADDGCSDCILNHAFCPVRIFPKFLWRKPKDGMMPVAMAADLVPELKGSSGQLGKTLGYPSEEEKGGVHVIACKQLKQSLHIGGDARGERL